MGQYVSFDQDTMSNSSLTEALLVANSGITIDANSIVVQYGTSSGTSDYSDYNNDYDYDEILNDSTTVSSLSFYTAGAQDGLSIGSGLLLSSGTASPEESNSSEGYSTSLASLDGAQYSLTDADLAQTATLAFSGSGDIYDATTLQFNFEISDLFTHGIKFDLVFGSDEYPEYSDSSYVDIAGIYLNGVNVALFNNEANQPLSVISQNLNVGNFQDNQDGHIPIEYDGVSNKMTVFAPVQPGINTLKIAIGDTGDSALDSGLYVANLQGTQLTGSGLSSVTSGTDTSETMTGTDNNETFDAGDGDDTIDPGAGDDIVLAGAGDDIIVGGNGDNQIDGGTGFDTVTYAKKFAETYIKIMDNDTIHVGLHSDNLLNVEEIKFSDMSFNASNLLIEDDIAKIYIAYFGRAADPEGLKYWLNQANTQLSEGRDYSSIIFDIASAYSESAEAESIYTGINAGNMNEEQVTTFISNIYNNLFDRDAEQAGLDYWVKDALALQESGKNVGTIVKTIIDGAQDQQGQLDRTFMQNKAQVAWDYAKQYELVEKAWDSETLGSEAQAVLTGITTEDTSVNAQFDHILTLFS